MTAAIPLPPDHARPRAVATAQVPVDRIVLTEDTLRDRPLDDDHVALLADVLDETPLVVVQRGSLRLIDGRHRLEAARRRDQAHITVEVVDIDDALLIAERIRRNAAHGLPLTRAERRRAIEALLDRHPEWSDRRIARFAGTAHTTVGRVRRDRPGGAPCQVDTPRMGADGKTYPAPDQLAAAHRQVIELLGQDPALSDRSIARGTGLSPSTVGRLREQTAAAGQQAAAAPDAKQPSLTRLVSLLVAWLSRLLRIVMRPAHETEPERMRAPSRRRRSGEPPPHTPPHEPAGWGSGPGS